MTEPAPQTPPVTPPMPPPTPGTPWHQGVDAEFIGHWNNKGWKADDPKEIAIAATKQARELEKHFGVPPEQLLKMPKADAPEADLKAFYQRLGAPADPKEYDFSAVKFNGADLEQSFSDAMRGALSAAFVPKDKAGGVVSAVVKFLEDAEKAESAVSTAKVAEEKTKLKVDWGTNYDFNHLKAMEGARRLGIVPEAIQALEGQIGYAAVMNAMRKIGMGTSEDTFVERGASGGTAQTVGVTTREGAVARLNELKADKAWGAKLLSGDAATRREWTALEQMAAGETL